MSTVAASPTAVFPPSLFSFLSAEELPSYFRDIRPRRRRARLAVAPLTRSAPIAKPQLPAVHELQPSVRPEDDLERWDGLS